MQRHVALFVAVVITLSTSIALLRQVSKRLKPMMSATMPFGRKSTYSEYPPLPKPKDSANADVRLTQLESGATSMSVTASTLSALDQNTNIVEYTDREDLYAARREVVRNGCLRLNKTLPTANNFKNPSHFLIETRHNILFCEIPKVGSTFWKKVLTAMGSTKIRDVHTVAWSMFNLTGFKKLTSIQLESLKTVGTSFFFIRDPYARLFSGYENKIYHCNTMFWHSVGRGAVAVTRNTTDARYKHYGFDVTFPEFVKYILHNFQRGLNINNHFKPMHNVCDPCENKFQYIGKLETLKDDYEFLLTKWRKRYPDVNVTISHFDRDFAMATAKGHVNFLFATKAILDEIKFPFSKLMLRTWRDLQIRGYISRYLEFPFKDYVNVDNITKEDMLKALEMGIDSTIDKVAAKSQREMALIQAYRGVPMEDMELLSKYVAADCTLFGYDQRPDKLFDRSKPIDTDFVYLDGLY